MKRLLITPLIGAVLLWCGSAWPVGGRNTGICHIRETTVHTKHYDVAENVEGMEKIDGLLENHKDWRYILGRYQYAGSHPRIPEELRLSMRAGVLQKLDALQTKAIITPSMAIIIAAEFDRKIGMAPSPPASLKNIYQGIVTEISLMEELRSEGKICRWVNDLAIKRAEEKLGLLQVKKAAFQKNLKIKPDALGRLEERYQSVLEMLNGLYQDGNIHQY